MKITDVLRELGAKYCIRLIDDELVIYRDLGNFELEVSGLEVSAPVFGCSIYVWDKLHGGITEQAHEIKSVDEFRSELVELERAYSN